MKIQIITKEQECVEGVSKIVVSSESLEELQSVVDNSCSLVMLESTIDYLDYKKSFECLNLAIKKTRINGDIVINGLCFDKIANSYLNQELEIYEINEKIYSCSSMQSYDNIIFLLEDSNFLISIFTHSGPYYQIKAKRMG